LKIIQIISDTNIGGAGIYLLTFLRHYDKNRFDMEVFLPAASALIPDIRDIGVKYTELEHISDKSFSLRGVLELRRLLKAEKPDIIHTHASMSARVAAKFTDRKIKIIYTRHTMKEPSAKMRAFPLKHINGAVNGFFCDRIIAVSPAPKKNLTDAGVSDKIIEVVFNGTDTPKVFSDTEKVLLRQKYGIDKDKFAVAMIGRLAAVKGHNCAIAAADICKKDNDIIFIFAGTGPLEDEIKKQIKTLGLNNIIMPGFVKEICEIENIMDLQINASTAEALCLSLLEGMSLGKPAAAPDCGGIPYVIEHNVNGLIFPKGDAAALAANILNIKSDAALRQRLAAGAAEVYEKRFTAEKMVSRICELYEEVLDG